MSRNSYLIRSDIVIAWAAEAVGVPKLGPEAHHQTATQADENTNANDIVLSAAANDLPGFSPVILESSQVSVGDGITSSSSSVSSTECESQLAKQRQRISQLTMEDIAKLMHLSKKDAAKELKISTTSLKRLCRKNNTDRWPARKVRIYSSKACMKLIYIEMMGHSYLFSQTCLRQ